MNNLIKNINFKNLDFNFKSKSRPTIFVHTDTDLSGVREKKDIILSPAYYWCKKEELEITSLRKAKKLSESIFFSNLPDGEYKYLTVKKDGDFLFFAYNEKYILDTLKKQGLQEEFFGDIYFAQNEIDGKRAVKINENTALITKDSMVLTIPLIYTQDYVDFSSLKINLSNNYIKLKLNVIGKERDEKIYLVASIFLGLWLVSEVASSFLLNSTLQDIDLKKREVPSKYKLPTTSFQLEAIEKKYAKIEKKQRRIREVLTEISSFDTNEKAYFQEVELEKNSIKAIFFTEKSSEKTKVLADLKKSFKGANFVEKDNLIEIRIKL